MVFFTPCKPKQALKVFIFALLLGVANLACTSNQDRVQTLEIELESVNKELKAIETAHPEVEETLHWLKDLKEVKSLLQFIVKSRDETLKSLAEIPPGEGPLKLRFVP